VTEYFLGIEPPEAQLELIAQVMTRLGSRAPVPHITLVPPRVLAPDLAWLADVRRVTARSLRPSIEFGSVGLFGDRVVYLTVQSPMLEQLQRRLFEAALPGRADSDEHPPDRKYVAHLTLVDLRHANDEIVREGVMQGEQLLPLAPFVAKHLVIFRRADGESRYRGWKRFALRGRYGSTSDDEG
jgi:2'-5' RNA ligase